MVVVAFPVAEVPVTVSVEFPCTAVVAAVKVSVLAEEVGFGENAAVTPLGSPEMASFTLPENPGPEITEIVPVVVLPGSSSNCPVLPSVKVGAATVSGNVTVEVLVFQVPVTVTVLVPTVAVLLAVSVSIGL